MRRLFTWYKEFIRKHIVCWPEEYYCPYSRPSDQEPVADVNVLRSSVHRYFKYNQTDRIYIIPFEPIYSSAIESIREDGWRVELHADSGGELFYTVSAKQTTV